MDPPTAATPTTSSFRVLTLNCWGLLGVARHRHARLSAIGRALAATDADAVCLQEVWVAGDAARLAALAAAGGRLVYAHHFRCGAFGAGLVTLAAHPIVAARFARFAAAGDPLALHQGDAVAGKGVGCVRLALPCGAAVDVFNTHLSAAYSDAHGRREAAKAGGGGAASTSGPAAPPFIAPRDFNGGIRLAQVVQLADFVRGCCAVQGPSVAAVLAGDFNAPPTSLELALLTALLPPGSADAWAVAGDGDGGGGFTANVPGGTYTTTGAGKRPARLDYLFSVGAGAKAVQAAVAMHLDPATGRSFSDHAGVVAVFALGGGEGGVNGGNGWEAVEAPPPPLPAAGDTATPSPSKRGPGAWLGSLSGGRRTPGGSGGSGSGGRQRRRDQAAVAAAATATTTTAPTADAAATLAAAAPLIEATAARMRCAADGAGFGAAVAALVAAAALAILIAGAAAGPRFRLPLGASVPLLAVLTAAALAAPCLATAGYVDRHAQAAALSAVAREVRILLAAAAGRAGEAAAVVRAGVAPAPAAVARPRPAPAVPPPPPQHLRVPAFSYA